ncbi:MAG: flagellar hook-associated protein 2 [Castellaniella sp.]|uniref:flagellar filament capping protein FliD n=1 Tax=Castellaniella sp. TaxID=1955812 RepID=UPI0012040C26|nr:flagellar filament capping protein FliD [Castellaniella sp.]TAN30320.1 MAG: flagellar hook-associated protein 2 [Castellaniella sp.]
MATSVAPVDLSNTSLFSSMGVGSGLPLGTLLTQLQTSEEAALQPIQSQEGVVSATLSAYGQVQGAVTALQVAAQALTTPGTFNALQTSVTGSGFTASAGAGAVAGQYSVTVDQLAKSQTLVTSGQASATAANGTGGTVTLTLGDGSTHTLDMTGKDTSLNGLVSAINADPSLGVSATLINDGSSTPYHLLLIANGTGTQAAVKSISSSNGSLQSLLGFTQGSASSVTESAAANAQLHIDGIAVTSQSNTVQGAISGVTLTLNAVNATPSTLAVTQDNTKVTDAVQGFVNAYNTLQSTVQSLTAYDTTSNSGSVLTGDSLALQVQSQTQSALDTFLPGGTISSLFQLGVSSDPTTGKLSLDTTALSQALAKDPTGVQNVLGGTAGVGKAVQTLTTNMLETGGLFSNADSSLNQTLKDLQSQYTEMSNRISADMSNYRQQFTALDSMVAQMNSLSSYLTQQLSGISSSSSSKSAG